MTSAQAAYWDTFLKRTGLKIDSTAAINVSMPGDATIADRLLACYLNGSKTAGSGLVKSYEVAGEPLPKVGDYWMILDSREHPKCIAKTIRVEITPFLKVTEDIAIAEADGSLENWREEHRWFFGKYLAELGIEDLDQALVVTEFFEVFIEDPQNARFLSTCAARQPSKP